MSKECCQLTPLLWSRHKIPNQSKCVCDADIWQGISSAEGAGVVQSDGGVKGKRKVVGALGLEASLKWWNRSMSQRQALMAREISWQTVRRSLVSVMKWKLGCVIACVVTDWLTDATSLHASIKCWACTCMWGWECVCAFANEAQYSVVCVITEQVGDLKGTRDSEICRVYRERAGVCLAWQPHPINCTALSKLHSNHLAQTETKIHCSDGGRRR